MQMGIQPVSIGFVLAFIVLILVVGLCLTGAMEFQWLGAILCALAVSRLV